MREASNSRLNAEREKPRFAVLSVRMQLWVEVNAIELIRAVRTVRKARAGVLYTYELLNWNSDYLLET